jgi:hypothetical protein
MKVDASSFWMVIGTQMPKILDLILVYIKKKHMELYNIDHTSTK